MQRTLSTVLAASMMTFGIAQAKIHDIPDQARRNFHDLEVIAFSVANYAEDIDSPTRGPRPSTVDLDDLATMKDQINQAGKELRMLDSERSSLQPWEEQLMDQVSVLMADAARNETAALHIYNQNGSSRPLPVEFRDHVKQIKFDADKAARMLKDDLQLDKARSTEDKILHTTED